MIPQILSVSLEFQNNWEAILYILCGLGIFLYGIGMMSSSLKSIAGDRMKLIIKQSTNTPIKGMLVGFVVTMLTQSSSGTSALAVSLVASGLMSFSQALGVLLGANIGGTILTIILAFASQLKIMPYVSVALVFVGAVLIFFFKKKMIKEIGQVILAFGLIFLGLAFIDLSFDHFLENYGEQINTLFENLANIPILGIVVGTLFTFVVQSSSATIGIVQSMYQVGSISLYGALALMLGANIGTTITALIASMGSSKTAKKVAVANTLIKLFGVICFGICYRWAYYPLVNWFNVLLGWTKNPMIISLAHLSFNIINSFVFLGLLKPLTWVCDKLLGKGTEENIEDALLDYSLIKKSPALALSFVQSAICHMAETTKQYVHITKDYSFERNDKLIQEGIDYERHINCLDKRIHDYLIKLTISELDKKNSTLLSNYLDLIKDLERVGDHCSNIFEFFEERYEKDMHLSEDGVQDLEQIYTALQNMTDGTVEAIKSWDEGLAKATLPYEDEIDSLEETLHERHIHRVNSGTCSFMNTEHYVEILSNIERMGDHLTNVLGHIVKEKDSTYDEFNH